MSKPILAALFALILLPSASAVHAASITAAWQVETKGNEYASFGGDGGPVPYRGQTFTAEQSGALLSVRVRMGRWGLRPGDMHVEVRRTDSAGLPSDEVLDFAEMPIADLPNLLDAIVTFDFAAQRQITTGVKYAVIAYPIPFSSVGDPFYFNGDSGSGEGTYTGGAAVASTDGVVWVEDASVDYHFEVVVDETVAAQSTTFGRIKQLY